MVNASTFTQQRLSIQLTSEFKKILGTDDFEETDSSQKLKVDMNYPDEIKEKSMNFPYCPQKKKTDIEKFTVSMLLMIPNYDWSQNETNIGLEQ